MRDGHSARGRGPARDPRGERRRGLGVSLVELLIAVLILAAVLVGVFRGIRSGYQGTERLIEETYASNHAISLLEALTCVSYSNLPEIPAGTSDVKLKEIMEAAKVPGFNFPGEPDPDYQRVVEVREICKRTYDPSDAENSQWGALKRIQVAVTWKRSYLPSKAPRTLVFRTLLTDDTEVAR